MRHILYSMFLNDVIKSLHPKYQGIYEQHLDKTFLCANFVEIPLYYKLFTYKKNADYNLYEKLHFQKKMDVINYFVEKIQTNHYDPNIILLLYGYITHNVLDHYLETYIKNILRINNMKFNMKNYSKISSGIEAKFYEEIYKEKISKYQMPQASFDEKEFEVINEILSNIFYMRMGINVYKISYNKFMKYQKHWTKDSLGIKKTILKILDFFTKKKKYSAQSISRFKVINKKIDYLNEKKNALYLFGNYKEEKTFEELYKKAITDCYFIIHEINDVIFYQKKSKSGLETLINRFLRM